jgi:hypothetical protein
LIIFLWNDLNAMVLVLFFLTTPFQTLDVLAGGGGGGGAGQIRSKHLSMSLAYCLLVMVPVCGCVYCL